LLFATHPDLTELSSPELGYQVAASRRDLRREFAILYDNFCYPSSEYDAATHRRRQGSRLHRRGHPERGRREPP
jgi:hypothetical protein